MKKFSKTEIRNWTNRERRKKEKQFKKPTYRELKNYAEQIDFTSLEPQRFLDFYESKGWMVGSNKMKDWKAAVRNWQLQADFPEHRKNRVNREQKKKDYAQLRKHPFWQKKRLKIFERDNWQCQQCGNKEVTLNVHHKCYLSNKKPWEYPNDTLITLCEKCHKEETEHMPQAINRLSHTLKKHFFAAGIETLADAFEDLPLIASSLSQAIAISWWLIQTDLQTKNWINYKKALSSVKDVDELLNPNLYQNKNEKNKQSKEAQCQGDLQ